MRNCSWLRIAAALMLFAFALVPADAFLHGHDEQAQVAGHDHCAVCHVRHLSMIETPTPPSVLTPDLVAHAAPVQSPSFEPESSRALHPSRGPPA